MAMRFDFESGDVFPREDGVRLSGRVLGQLGPAEQFVLWAMRESAVDCERSRERLVEGFRAAFGADLFIAAACGFYGLRRCLAADPTRAPRLCPLTCACLSIDEQTLLYGLAAAQIGDWPMHIDLFSRFVHEESRERVWQHSRTLGSAMSEAGLCLPDSRLIELPRCATCH